MKLRKLKEKDAPLMLEWMHDPEAVAYMRAAFSEKTLEDCVEFIMHAEGVHFAVVDENDEYLGTVSLKHIENGCAEFGIALRRKAMGKGYARAAMGEMLKIGFEDLSLKQIYWCVDPKNARAIRFYEKNGYTQVPFGSIYHRSQYSSEEMRSYIWFQVSRTDEKV